MPTRRLFLVLCLAFSSAVLGCTKEEVKPEAKPILGVLELPISHRHASTEPSDAARIEIGTSEIRVGGETVIALENGKIPAAERDGDVLPKLKAKLAGKRVLAISVFAASPYATLARVINTGFEAGARSLAFKVRKPGSNTDVGWLTLNQGHFTPTSEDGKFGDALLPWEKFTAVWEEALSSCQAGMRGGDCGYRPLGKAEGGKLDMMLRVRGSGLALRFRQTGAPPKPEPVAKPKAELLEGVKGAKRAAAAAAAEEEQEPEPATEHLFNLRAEQAAEVPSSVISDIVKPVCGSISCPVVMDSEGISMSGTVLSLIGAAFPDNTPEPNLAWVMPRK